MGLNWNLKQNQESSIDSWKRKFEKLKKTGNPTDIISIEGRCGDGRSFIVEIVEPGSYGLHLEIEESVIQELERLNELDVVKKYPYCLWFTNTKSLAEFVTLNLI